MNSLSSGTSKLPQRQKSVAEKGWLSRATFESLPPRFQKAALTLKKRGELLIGDTL